MNYEIIKTLCQERGINFEILAEKVGMSTTGFYASIKNRTMRVETLEKIAEVLVIPICRFFSSPESESSDPIQTLRTYLINHNLSFNFQSNLESIFIINQFELTRDISLFAETELDAKEIKFLLKKTTEVIGEFENILMIAEEQNGSKKTDLITNHLLYKSFAIEYIQSEDKKKKLKRLQTIMCDKYLELVKKDAILNFLIKEDLFDKMQFTLYIYEYIKRFVDFSTGKELLINKGFMGSESK